MEKSLSIPPHILTLGFETSSTQLGGSSSSMELDSDPNWVVSSNTVMYCDVYSVYPCYICLRSFQRSSRYFRLGVFLKSDYFQI